LNIAVATLLISVLILAAGGLVEDQRERVADAELSVVGERLASDLQSADRLASSPDATTVVVRSQLPARVAGESYEIHVESNGDLQLTTDGPGEPVRVPVPLSRSVSDTTVSGGDVVIEFDGSGNLEVRSSD
jgi:hypothetical protein